MKRIRLGDRGKTRIFNKEVSKSEKSVDALGNLDELNSFIGVCRTLNKDEKINGILEKVQKDLFSIGAEIASHTSNQKQFTQTTKTQVESLDKIILVIENQLPKLNRFILPAGTRLASMLHVARSVCRRAERSLVKLSEEAKLNENILPYANRLSSLLFSLARYSNKLEGVGESEWKAR